MELMDVSSPMEESNPGDVAKAFGSGADFVMCGSLFAGHDESAGELRYDD